MTLFWLFAAALTLLVLAAPSMATKQQLKIKLHRHQAADAEVAGTKLEAHLCGAAKLATHSLAASEDKGLDLYHQARALIGEALQRG